MHEGELFNQQLLSVYNYFQLNEDTVLPLLSS
jgi:hypothetical protein